MEKAGTNKKFISYSLDMLEVWEPDFDIPE